MAGVGAPLMVAWQACGRDEGGGRSRGQQGARPRVGGLQGGGRPWRGAMGALHEELTNLSVSCARSGCVVREVGEEGRRKERRKEKEGKETKKRKNMEKISKLENF
jgi:hypothetical protein